MNKYILVIAFAIVSPILASACDICGCGVGNNYIGILPDFSKKIFGLRYRYSSLVTHVGVGGEATYLTTNETYKTVEAWGGYNISAKFRLMASVPYSFNNKFNQGVTHTKNGLGDITVLGYYQAINNRKTVDTSRLLVQSLWLGGGIKTPTGRYNPSDKSATNDNINLFQLGTASTDFILSAMYDIRLQDAGLNVSSSYKFNTSNKYDYQYGHKLNVNTQAYYKFRIKHKWTLAPNTGIQYERAQKDNDKSFAVGSSGGNLLLGTAGIEANFKTVSIGGNYQTPLSQSLANGIVRANDRFMMHISFAL